MTYLDGTPSDSAYFEIIVKKICISRLLSVVATME